jgi:DNA-directed RNA polymerase specialized sigma subunit
LIQLMNPYICRDYDKVSFSPEQEEAICKVVPKDAIARLELVKTCMELVVKFANWHASESGKPFNQLVQSGILAVVKSAENYCNSEKSSFSDYISQEIMRAMSDSSKPDL